MRLLLFGFFIAVFPTIAFCQNPIWQRTFGGTGSDNLWELYPTIDGGVICGGASMSANTGDKSEYGNGNSDMWIVRFESNGNELWQNTIGGSEIDRCWSIQQTADGGYIIAGDSESDISGDKSENCRGGLDFWIIKLYSSGTIQWQKTIGGDLDDIPRSIIQTSDHGYLCGGLSFSNISGDKTENCNGVTDFWVVKLDSLGNIQWQNTIGGTDQDAILDLKQTAEGDYLLGGYSHSGIGGDKTEACLGTFDYWIVNIDSMGNIQWQNTIGGSDMEVLGEIEPTIDGGSIVGGFSLSGFSNDKTGLNQGGYDYWVVKLDSLGNIQWDKTIGGNQDDVLYGIFQKPDGNFVCGGYSRSPISGDKTELKIGSEDFWSVTLDNNGDLVNQSVIGGTDYDEMYSIELSSDGNYYAGGSSQSNFSGDKSENSRGYWDYWVTKLSSNFNLISGQTYQDLNSNNIKDTGENIIKHLMVTEINSGIITFTQSSGTYYLSFADSGNCDVWPSALNYHNSVPINHIINFTSVGSLDSLNDFAFQPNGNFNDLCVNITPSGPFRSGLNATYGVEYMNLGTTSLNATLVFYPDSAVSFISSTPNPTTIASDSVVYSIGTLAPYQTGFIYITVAVEPGLPIGTLINSGVLILPIIGDANTICNADFRELLTTGPYDPNDIIVNKDTLYNFDLITPPFLEYTIRFQNTGNDTAFYVRVGNNIPSELNLNTFELISSSNPVNLTYHTNSRLMEFEFFNINLPDSNVNEPLSHGFVRYRIKPLTSLLVGDSIKNRADIYFDLNEPVSTNSAVTLIALPTGHNVLPVDNSVFSVYPNPVNSILTININVTLQINVSIDLYNSIGQHIQHLYSGLISDKWHSQLNISSIPAGVYYVKVSGDINSATRFIKF